MRFSVAIIIALHVAGSAEGMDYSTFRRSTNIEDRRDEDKNPGESLEVAKKEMEESRQSLIKLSKRGNMQLPFICQAFRDKKPYFDQLRGYLEKGGAVEKIIPDARAPTTAIMAQAQSAGTNACAGANKQMLGILESQQSDTNVELHNLKELHHPSHQATGFIQNQLKKSSSIPRNKFEEKLEMVNPCNKVKDSVEKDLAEFRNSYDRIQYLLSYRQQALHTEISKVKGIKCGSSLPTPKKK